MKNLKNRRALERKKWDKAVFIETSLKEKKMHAKGVDISQEGLGLITEQELNVGQIVKVYFPIAEEVMIPVFAEVVWSSPKDSSFRNGLFFIY